MTALDAAPAFPLAMAEENVAVRVVAIRGGTGLARRIAEIGQNVGSELSVRQREGAGLIVMRGETRFALGAGLANRIMVRPLRAPE